MRLILLLGAALLMLGCGQKGPLYLPAPDKPAPPADTCQVCPPVIMPAPTAAEEKAEKKSTESTPSTAVPQESNP